MHTNSISICLRWLCVNTSNTPMYAPSTRRASFKCGANRKEPTALLFVICLPKPLWLWEQGPQLEERQQKRRPEYSKKTSFVWTASYSGQTKETGLWGISLWRSHCSSESLNESVWEAENASPLLGTPREYSVCSDRYTKKRILSVCCSESVGIILGRHTCPPLVVEKILIVPPHCLTYQRNQRADTSWGSEVTFTLTNSVAKRRAVLGGITWKVRSL